MGVLRVAMKKLMDSFGFHLDFLPEKKLSRGYGTTYCNVINMFKGETFEREFRVCNIRTKPGVWEPIRGNEDILRENLGRTIFAYLGVEEVADELMEMSQEYSEELIRKGHFDD